jgi:hypothetical protein
MEVASWPASGEVVLPPVGELQRVALGRSATAISRSRIIPFSTSIPRRLCGCRFHGNAASGRTSTVVELYGKGLLAGHTRLVMNDLNTVSAGA